MALSSSQDIALRKFCLQLVHEAADKWLDAGTTSGAQAANLALLWHAQSAVSGVRSRRGLGAGEARRLDLSTTGLSAVSCP